MKRVNIKCPYCRSQAFLRPASVVYGQGHSEPNTELYVCARYPICDAYVAAHRHNHLPMGTLANRELRRKRIAAHAAFNRCQTASAGTAEWPAWVLKRWS